MKVPASSQDEKSDQSKTKKSCLYCLDCADCVDQRHMKLEILDHKQRYLPPYYDIFFYSSRAKWISNGVKGRYP